MEKSNGHTADTSSSNPYAPPASHISEVVIPKRVSPRNIMVAWEGMRLRYNLILLLPGLIVVIIFVGLVGLPIQIALFGSAIIAIAANVCYFLGAASECLACFLFKTSEHPGYRKAAYIAGIALSLVLFVLVCLPVALFAP